MRIDENPRAENGFSVHRLQFTVRCSLLIVHFFSEQLNIHRTPYLSTSVPK